MDIFVEFMVTTFVTEKEVLESCRNGYVYLYFSLIPGAKLHIQCVYYPSIIVEF